MPPASLANVPLIARAILFGNPTRAQGQIAPDGRWLSWLAPKDGVLNVWIAPIGASDRPRVVTDDKKRGIRFYAWAYTSRHLLYVQDEGGNEDWHVYAVPIDGGPTLNLTPFAGVNARIEQLSLDHPNLIAIAINDRHKAWHDLYRIDINTGARELLFENTHELAGIMTDRQLVPRLAIKPRSPEGGKIVYRIDGTRLDQMLVVEHEDDLTTHPVGFTRDGRTLYSMSSLGRDKAALLATDWEHASTTLVAEHPKADISRVVSHPVTGVVEAVGAKHLALDWIALNESIAADFKHLYGVLPGEVSIADRSLDDRYWVVSASAADNPTTYHLYQRDRREVSELFATQPELKSYALAPMRGELIRARDGLELPSYYTLPPSEHVRPRQPLPMVLVVHGGPWARDEYGFNPIHQWLANRGFAVLSVNFRASTGFGKAFVNAGDREWGRKMHEDLLDAVAWAVAAGIADQDRIAIMGGSYGGYATLVGLTFTPEVFCCGVDIVGPSNLETLLATIPPYWAAFFETLARRVGDPRTPEGQRLLKARSPLHAAARIARPLLIGQGANDPRVKQAESDQIIAAMREKHLPVTYVLYPEEGHGFAEPANRIAFYAIAEAFLAEQLGGRLEPIGNDFTGADFEVPHGRDAVPGLAAALKTTG
jgi:dipeptidyl aminopeptidase/acylaminoacyl peptidase